MSAAAYRRQCIPKVSEIVFLSADNVYLLQCDFSFAGQVENEFSEADQLYERWEKEWREMTASDRIDEGETYYKKLWEDEIIGGAHEEYDRRNGNGGGEDVQHGYRRGFRR